MDNLNPQALAVIVAALIAASLTFLSLLVSKEHKISEFRQAWIDSLRDDLAQILSHTHVIADAYKAGVITDEKQDWVAVREDLIAANSAEIRIRLRLNPNEDQNIAILDLIKELDDSYVIDCVPNYDTIYKLEEKITAQSHIILKKEWKRVKRGEKVFFATKWLSLVVVFASAGYFVYDYFW
jgi:hypothetical protein